MQGVTASLLEAGVVDEEDVPIARTLGLDPHGWILALASPATDFDSEGCRSSGPP